jgi:hypothetical protein
MQCVWVKLLFVASPTVPYLSTLSHKPYGLRKKVIEYKICVLISLTSLSETFLILRKTRRDMIINVYWPSSTVHFILVRFYRNFISLEIFEKYSNTIYRGSPSNCSGVVSCGRTDMTKPIVTVRNLPKAPKNWQAIFSTCPMCLYYNSFKHSAHSFTRGNGGEEGVWVIENRG